MKIRITKAVGRFRAGESIDLANRHARQLIVTRFAEEVTEPTPEPEAPEVHEEEKKPRRRRRTYKRRDLVAEDLSRDPIAE